jgi:hypothetical protein
MTAVQRFVAVWILFSALIGCTSEQVQGPATVAGVLVAPLAMPLYALSTDCELPQVSALGLSPDDTLIAASCDVWPISLIGWVDAYFIYSDGKTVPASELFRDFSRHQVFPCTDGAGHIYSVRKRWDSLWLARYSLATPQADPFVRKVDRIDGRLEQCLPVELTQATSPDQTHDAGVLSGVDEEGNGYRYIVVTRIHRADTS